MYANPNQLRFQKSVALIKPIRLSFKQEGAKYFFFFGLLLCMVIIFDFESRERLGRAEHVIEAKDTLVNTSAHILPPPTSLQKCLPCTSGTDQMSLLLRQMSQAEKNLILKDNESNMSLLTCVCCVACCLASSLASASALVFRSSSSSWDRCLLMTTRAGDTNLSPSLQSLSLCLRNNCCNSTASSYI